MINLTSNLINAKRISFVKKLPEHAQAFLTFPGPEKYYAITETVSPDELMLKETLSCSFNEFYFLFVQSGSVVPYEIQKTAEQWLSGQSVELNHSYVEFNWNSDRILWIPGKVLINGKLEHLNELLTAIINFSFYECGVRRLEKQLREDFITAISDVPLTHAVKAIDLQHQSHVNEMTCRVTLGRMQFIQIESNIGHGAVNLSGSAKRITSELALLAEIFPRLEILDDQLEYLEDLYELANDRLTEFKYFRTEALIEWGIVALLVLELIAMLWKGL